MSTSSPDSAPGTGLAHEEALRAGPPHAAPPPAPARGRRPLAVGVTGVVLAAVAGFAARGLWQGGTHPPVAAAVTAATALVVRTDLSARQLVAGTLGYQGFFTVASESGGGIITWLPAAGDIVRRGQPLFAVDGQPVTLLYGSLPAWRPFVPGMTAGPDVRQLQRNLAALGFDPGPADGVFGWGTELAVQRWQQSRDETVTGTIPLGAVAFLPGPLRVTATPEQPGAPVAAGASVVSGTSLTAGVQVWLPVGGPAVRRGDQVTVTMPDGTTTVAGTVTAVGSVATVPGASGGQASGSGQGGSANSSGSQAAEIPVTITISAAIPAGLDQAPVQVSITQRRADGVLAVPVTALLAAPGGGYEIQVAGSRDRLIPVTTGLFDDATGLVAVTGSGLAPGLAVTVAQG
ncbi:peptidoglycan-binding protein [Trebonia kvetii]|nr:peptidoglycan-binding protein [Trebonia kvetii]